MAASNPGWRHAESKAESHGTPTGGHHSAALALLGRRVRTLRAQAGLTQVEVAQRLGMSRFTVMSLESGRHDIGASRLP
ncbi:helix-turn-helix transcriptional regulator, partial [Nocardioides sp.]|uniref:helix-turn-helix transcriptional regulator n=1 Tax=Nocardioides sp. TaxID=35761 RepID=UPI0037C6ECE5